MATIPFFDLIKRLLLSATLCVGAAPCFGQLGGFSAFGGFGEEELVVPVTLEAQFTAATPQRPAVLMVTAQLEPGYHVYGINQPDGGPQRTTIQLAPSESYRVVGEFRATPEPHRHIDQIAFKGLELHEHEDQVTWYAPIELAPGVDPEGLQIAGHVSMQACKEACEPVELDFSASLGEGVAIGPLPTQLARQGNNPAGAAPAEAAPLTANVDAPAEAGGYQLEKVDLGAQRSLGPVLLLALVGGFALNFMPCVLPVIGLKVMSFVHQSGNSRSAAFALNAWYALGMLLVFWVLAGLAVYAGFTWGEHFGDSRFNIAMAAIVFALALSMLGVWEIPIPGFVGHGAAQDLASREGPLGALSKGVLTTVLATPCTGPGMGAALGWAVKQPAGVTFAVFTAIGLGMALPYLVIGAFPSLVRFIPKPGAWMESFKQLLGFVLMGTVVWLISPLPPAMILPTVSFLVAVALACWVYSRMPYGAPWSEQSQTYSLCTAVLVGGAVLAYGVLLPDVFRPRLDSLIASAANEQAATSHAELLAKLRQSDDAQRQALLAQAAPSEGELSDQPWQSFSLKKLSAALEGGHSVVVDFSADWCANCKVLESTVLHTDAVDEAIREHGVVTMYGDFTHKSPVIKQMLTTLGANGVPVIAVFPQADPYRPIVFRDGYTQAGIIEAIEEASQRGKDRLASSDLR